MWFLSWTPWALSHGVDPLLSSHLNAPIGVNLMWNTAAPLLGVLLWPVTALFGMVAAYNTLVTLGVALSGLAACWAARRFVTSPAAALACGLAYEFCPFITVQAQAHAKVVFAALPPLLLGLGYDVVVRQRWSPRRGGAILGAVLAAQLLVFEESVALAVVASAVGLGVLGLLRRDGVMRLRGYLGRMAGWTAATFAVLSAMPLGIQFLGPNRIGGTLDGGQYVSDLANLAIPTAAQWISPDFASAISTHFPANPVENNAYLGPAILGLVAWTVWRHRTELRARWLATTSTALVVLSLGSFLHVAGRAVWLPLPWLAFEHLPLLGAAFPSRLFIDADLLAAVMVGIFVDDLIASRTRNVRAAPMLAAVALLAAAAVSYVPKIPFASSPVRIPAFFTSPQLARAIPEGANTLVIPFTQNGSQDDAMLWQAASGMRFRMPEGYFISYRNGGRWDGPDPSAAADAFYHLYTGVARSIPLAERTGVLSDLRRWEVSRVILGPMPNRDAAEASITAILGPPFAGEGDVTVWRTGGS